LPARDNLPRNPEGCHVNSRGRQPTVDHALVSSALTGPNSLPSTPWFDPCISGSLPKLKNGRGASAQSGKGRGETQRKPALAALRPLRLCVGPGLSANRISTVRPLQGRARVWTCPPWVVPAAIQLPARRACQFLSQLRTPPLQASFRRGQAGWLRCTVTSHAQQQLPTRPDDHHLMMP